MSEKMVFFLLLFSLSNLQIINLTVFQLKDKEEITIQKPSGLICYELHNDFQTNKEFYLHIYSDDKEKKMNKTIFYNLTEVSCKNLHDLPIDLDNLVSLFKYSKKEPLLANENRGFNYEYNITKYKENQKFMLMLYKDFTGETLFLRFDLYSGTQASKFLLTLCLSILSFVVLPIGVCVCVGFCKRIRRNKRIEGQTQNQTEYPLHAMMPEENIV